ncbi:MAG: insulinase family protein, partial [Chloroflexi bacterium]|nr:insulinase family protein [Chloroflexota bacterium]
VEADVLERMEAAFGHIPARPLPPPLDVREPEQTSPREVDVRHPGPFPVLTVGHRIPEFAHSDFPALLALDALLSGPKSGPFGGGGIVRTSRLYRRFVASGLAAAVGTDIGFNIDPTLHRITVVLKPNGDREPIAEAVEEAIQDLHDAPPKEAELARAVRQARAKQAIGLEGVTAQAMWLGFLDIAHTWRAAQTFTDRLTEVSPQDVQRAAQTYLRPERRTTGWFIPEGPARA